MIYILHLFICFSLIIFQTTIAPYFNFLNELYDLLIPFVVFLGLFRSFRGNLPFVLFLGMVQDNLTGSAFGLFLTTYFWLFLSVRLLTLFFRKDNTFLIPVVVVSGILIENIIFITSSMLGSEWYLPSTAVNQIAAQLVWALFTGPVFLLIYRVIYEKCDKLISRKYSEAN